MPIIQDMSATGKFFAFLAAFFFLFAPRLAIGGGVSTGMLAVLCVGLTALKIRGRLTIPLPLVHAATFLGVLALYSAVMAEVYGNNPIYFVSICVAVTVSLTFSWFFAEILVSRNIEGERLIFFILTLVVFAIFANSLIIVFEYLIPPLKAGIESLLYLDATSNINYADHAFRFRGFASAGGASLSIVNAAGVLLIGFLYYSRKFGAAPAILLGLVIVISNIFTGRTGLIFGIVFFCGLLGLVLVRSMKSGMKGLVSAFVLVFSFALFMQYALNFQLDPEVALWAFEWVDGLMSGEVSSSSSDDLGTMLFLPEDAVHLFMGIGFFEGEGRLYPRSDSGYVKSIMTIGIFGSLMLYGFIAASLLRLRRISKRFVWLVGPLLTFLFIVEIKEPFLYQNFAARVVFLLSGAASLLVVQQRHARNSYHSGT